MTCNTCKHYYECPVHQHTGTDNKTRCEWVKVLDNYAENRTGAGAAL